MADWCVSVPSFQRVHAESVSNAIYFVVYPVFHGSPSWLSKKYPNSFLMLLLNGVYIYHLVIYLLKCFPVLQVIMQLSDRWTVKHTAGCHFPYFSRYINVCERCLRCSHLIMRSLQSGSYIHHSLLWEATLLCFPVIVLHLMWVSFFSLYTHYII